MYRKFHFLYQRRILFAVQLSQIGGYYQIIMHDTRMVSALPFFKILTHKWHCGKRFLCFSKFVSDFEWHNIWKQKFNPPTTQHSSCQHFPVLKMYYISQNFVLSRNHSCLRAKLKCATHQWNERFTSSSKDCEKPFVACSWTTATMTNPAEVTECALRF